MSKYVLVIEKMKQFKSELWKAACEELLKETQSTGQVLAIREFSQVGF